MPCIKSIRTCIYLVVPQESHIRMSSAPEPILTLNVSSSPLTVISYLLSAADENCIRPSFPSQARIDFIRNVEQIHNKVMSVLCGVRTIAVADQSLGRLVISETR